MPKGPKNGDVRFLDPERPDFKALLDAEASRRFGRGERICVKLHMGEPGNPHFLKPALVKAVVDSLCRAGARPFLFDSPVAYPGPRSTAATYLEAAAAHGFADDAMGCPVVVSDDHTIVDGELMAYGLSTPPLEADGVLVLTHVKGHPCTGFGGAVKNIGMGCVSRATKGAIHAGGKPSGFGDCSLCGECVDGCPVDAISCEGGEMRFDASSCIGCSGCVMSCAEGMLAPEVALFDSMLAEAAALAAARYRKTLYLNCLLSVVELCDCMARSSPVVFPDRGIVAGDDMVDVDAAAFEIFEKETGKDLFASIHGKSPLVHIDEAADYLGK